MQTNNTTNRNLALDALRGFAMLGILIVNIMTFTYSYDLTLSQLSEFPLAEWDDQTSFWIDVFFEGKFYSIFSLLWGIGFTLHFSKSDTQHILSITYKKRLLILLIIGLIHLMTWRNDTLVLYALLGFLLIPFRRLNSKTILVISAVFILSPILWHSLSRHIPELNIGRFFQRVGFSAFNSFLEKNNLTYYKYWSRFDSDFLFRLKAGVYNFPFRAAYLSLSHRAWKVFGMFLIGLAIGRTGIFDRLPDYRNRLISVFFVGLLIGIPANYYRALLDADVSSYPWHDFAKVIAFSIGVLPLSMSYCSLIGIISTNDIGKKILVIFSWVGRLSLSNYIFQTLLCVFIFSRFGLAVHYVGVTQSVLLAALIFVFQILASKLLLCFSFKGPLEWIVQFPNSHNSNKIKG